MFAAEFVWVDRRPVEQDELVYPDSVSNIFRITDDIYSAATGLSGDVRYQVSKGVPQVGVSWLCTWIMTMFYTQFFLKIAEYVEARLLFLLLPRTFIGLLVCCSTLG